MHRYLFQLGPLTLYSYGAMLALAFIVGTYLAVKRAQRQGIEAAKIIDLTMYVLISSLIGARLFFVALSWEYFKEHPADIFKIWEGGLVFYGGLITAVFFSTWFLKKHKLPIWKVLDVFSAPLVLGTAIGRVGCFLNGCCYGKISFAYGVSFPAKDNPPAFAQQVSDGLISPLSAYSQPVIPTQIYESAAYLLVFFLIITLERCKFFTGFSFWMSILLYSFFRFIIEDLRYYESGFLFGIFTVSQLISVILFIVALAALISLAPKGDLRKA